VPIYDPLLDKLRLEDSGSDPLLKYDPFIGEFRIKDDSSEVSYDAFSGKLRQGKIKDPVISGATAVAEDDSVVFSGAVNPNLYSTVVTLLWGTTENDLNHTIAAGTFTASGNINLTVLNEVFGDSENIYWRFKAVNASGKEVFSSVLGTEVNVLFTQYKTRVLADSGALRSETFTKDYINFLRSQGRINNVKLLVTPEMGIKTRTVGINKYVSKAYSPQLPTNDAVQATELSQPFLAGNIAPNSKYALQNPNGGTRLLTHPNISFAANEAWSITSLVNDNWGPEVFAGCIFSEGSSNAKTNFYTKPNNTTYGFNNESGASQQFGCSSLPNIGKNTIITLVANGGGTLKLYTNGTLKSTINIATNVSINRYMQGIGRYFNGRLQSHLIQSGALTDAQVLAEYNLLRSWIPEIENVTIGAQQWATSNLDVVCTPQGNVINEVQINSNTERVVNGGFTTNLSGWNLVQSAPNATITQAGGQCIIHSDGTGVNLNQACLTIGKWYKLSLNVVSISGTLKVGDNGTTLDNLIPAISSTGIKTVYFKASTTTIYIVRVTAVDAVIDDVSCLEVGWANSQELYDAIYAATAGTAEQKTYAALKAAAMWSYYNNDPVAGSVYGKLYNWFAAKLLQIDIDAYNTANPTSVWGWKVPLVAHFNTLISYLTPSGSKLRESSNLYWFGAPVGTNSSGFTAIPGGRRNADGTFSQLTAICRFAISEEHSATFQKYAALGYNDAELSINTVEKTLGVSIRLIKS